MTRAHRPGILLVNDSLRLGGTEGQFVEAVCRLDQSRWDVHVTCLRAEGPHAPRVLAAGLTPWSCGRGSFKSPRFATAVWALAREIRRRRIALVHTFDFYSNILGVAAARLAGVPVIASQRDMGDVRQRGQQIAQRIALRCATAVVVNGEAIAGRLRAEGLDGRRIAVVPNGVDLQRFADGAPARRFDRQRIGSLANLRPEKGMQYLLHAAVLVREQFPAARIDIWGDGPMRGQLERLVTTLGVGGTVTLHGKTEQPQRVLDDLDIFVLPSLSEGRSNVLLEAMAGGLAVIATDVGDSAAVVEDEVTGLVVARADPAALAKAIVRLLESPDLTTALAGRARARVMSEWSMPGMLARLDDLYARTLRR
jgi:glycosyltransferase involved in cell wall biosynthesis